MDAWLDEDDHLAEVITIELSRQPVQRSTRPGARAGSAVRSRPDRLAGWAVILCLLMALVAGATAGGEDDARDTDALPAVADSVR